jgi:hypothetical protein
MPKSKDFLSLLKTQGKINNPKFDELIEKVPDFEIDQEAVTAFENSFMTPERAASHPDVNRKIRFEVLRPIDRDFEKIIEAIGAIDKATAERLEALKKDRSTPDTYKRTDLLANSLSEIFSKLKTSKGGDEDLKKELEKKEKTLQDALEKLTNSEKEFTSRFQNQEKEYNSKLESFQLDNELEKLAGSFTLAEAYDKNRDAINKVILSELKSSNHLKLGTKDGKSLINVFDEKGEPRFNGNSPILINQLLEEKYKPFLKQSNADPEPSTPQTRTIPVNGKQTSVRRGTPTTVEKRLT